MSSLCQIGYFEHFVRAVGQSKTLHTLLVSDLRIFKLNSIEKSFKS